MTALRFGLMTHESAPWPELAERWRGFEAAGWDALWAGDHLWSGGDTAKPRFEAWLLAAGIANATSTAAVGTLVSAIGLRNPSVLAKQAVTLDHMSGGRAIAGIGLGGNPKDLAAAGLDPWPAAERGPRLAEYCAVVRAMLDGGAVEVGGTYYRARGFSAPGPVADRIPLLIAAHLPASIKVAARYADVWSTYGTLFSQLARGISLTPDESLAATARRSRLLDAECELLGRDPASVRRSFMLAFTQDTPWLSVQHFRDTIGRYAELGITEFMFPFPLQGKHDLEVFAEVVESVLPRLRKGERP
ncbi:LLM class flavin-dependent oxidoreductase [Saccharopolyspora sp. ASAGF58]|uniref:LLM class flavin-dependent oxidoreductase n=1 Tax=Saccharopolyspora sp. ASAGF58 TaxID=2719023 RepID=UPI00144012F0|nr:LLM class flavin-dependent oxidoreductase [Saccharopolyspora sp. ASAGF58]QIZ38786.1 LLM class flavin-dependent oxidoreductase [Saccharopolyspora sp. ASAGF58]